MKVKFHLGDRVFGSWNKIPFIGTVLLEHSTDNLTSVVHVQLDLPIIKDDNETRFITTKSSKLKKLTTF